jgi:hypothetical protein
MAAWLNGDEESSPSRFLATAAIALTPKKPRRKSR